MKRDPSMSAMDRMFSLNPEPVGSRLQAFLFCAGMEMDPKFYGFEWKLEQSQVGAVAAGLEGKVDIVDLAVLDILVQYSTLDGCKRITQGGKTYFLFSWTIIPKRGPFVPVKSRSAVKVRIKTLCDQKLLEPHPDNVSNGQSWFAFGPVYAAYKNFAPVRQTLHPSGKQDGSTDNPVRNPADPSGMPDGPRPEFGMDPVRNAGRNDCTFSDPTISDSLVEEEENQPIDELPKNPLAGLFNEWKAQIKKDDLVLTNLGIQMKFTPEQICWLADQFFLIKQMEPIGWSGYTACRKNFYHWALNYGTRYLKNFKSTENAHTYQGIQPGANQPANGSLGKGKSIAEGL